MCGLVGVMSSNMLPKHKGVLHDLLYLDTFRGKDSTGVAAIRSNADTHILKSTVPGYEFVEGPKLDQHLRLTDFLWLGHNRYGTVGRNCKTNAHPFEILDEDGACLLVGAHNGTLKNKHVLTDSAKFGTDSEALYNEIALTSVEEAIAKVEGAWALTYYDHIAEEFRVVRNKERPLFYAWSEDKKTLFWASEVWMLRIATQRADVKLFEDAVHSFAEDTLYRFPAPEKMNDEIVCVERKGGLVGKQAPAFFHQGQGQQGQAGGSSGSTNSTGTTNQQTNNQPQNQTQQVVTPAAGQVVPPRQLPGISTSQSGIPNTSTGVKLPQKNETLSIRPQSGGSGNKGEVVLLDSARKYKGYNGQSLTLAELKDHLDGGCSWCEIEMIAHTDRHAWLAPLEPICHKCLDGVPDEMATFVATSVSVH
jgi:predicted glutamine amidotransferase